MIDFEINFIFQYEIIGLLAKYFGGGLPVRDLEKMTWPQIRFWYKIYEKQVAEEEVINLLKQPDKKGNTKPMPSPKRIRELTDKKLAEWRAERGR